MKNYDLENVFGHVKKNEKVIFIVNTFNVH